MLELLPETTTLRLPLEHATLGTRFSDADSDDVLCPGVCLLCDRTRFKIKSVVFSNLLKLSCTYFALFCSLQDPSGAISVSRDLACFFFF